ncbi:MAG: hypothetical protein AB7F86_09170 [Bdellovibrionales bacterium]
MRQLRSGFAIAVMAGFVTFIFQNCDRARFTSVASSGSNGGLAIPCGEISCELTPLTEKPATTTILLALGDEVNKKLVGNPVSNQFLVESVIRLSSPVTNPKILIVRAKDTQGEDPEDTLYIQDLLLRYQSQVIDEPANGLTPNHLQGYDLIWFNNPGYPHSLEKTYQTLLAFDGAIVLQGDDMAWSTKGFSVSALTGLEFIDNGTRVVCGGQSYPHDNNQGEQYRVKLDPSHIQGLDQATIEFRYGNDIDNTRVTSAHVEVLATALGGPAPCIDERPVVVRHYR